MRFLTFFILPGLLPFSFAQDDGLTSGHFNEPTAASSTSLRGGKRAERSLQIFSHTNPPPAFAPLGCNSIPCGNGVKTWKTFAPLVSNKVVIPCGVCVTMDYDKNDLNGNITSGYYLKLPKGLEIQGSLIFPDNNQYRITVETPSVVVQGNLNMSAVSSIVTGQPLIRFNMTGSTPISFTPLAPNTMGCPVQNSAGTWVPGDCAISAKPFVVAGGRVDVRGLPATCKTWVKLQDVTTKPLSSTCAAVAGNMILNGNAEGTSPSPNVIGRQIGNPTSTARLAIVNIDNKNVYRIHGRGNDDDSIIQDLGSLGCFTPGTHFNLTATVQLNSTTPVTSIMGYRVYHRVGTSLKSYGVDAAICPPSSKNWVQCGAEFTFSLDPSIPPEKVEKVRFFFKTVNAKTVTMMVDDWKLQIVSGPLTTLVVPSAGVDTCWGQGSEILVTSHTTRPEDAQVRKLVKAPYTVAGDNGVVRLDLDKMIIPTVTAKHNDGFEVEVALLSRNIVLQGAKDEADPLLGGHFMVMNTPNVVQVLEGMEFNNFGRQGELGRYSLHFHLCQSTPSLISKNLIRNSNQRCVVVHGTHNLTISNNVAFNTFGHCFMTEDGGEINNKFISNLGALQKKPNKLPKPGESDDRFPSTFWTMNPTNEWIGNVAAGSEGLGFWFELEESVRPPTLYFATSKGMNPRDMTLTKFVNNTAHSCSTGMRTYPNGFTPPTVAIFENFRSYKNDKGGFLTRRSYNLWFKGGVLADNSFGASIENSVKGFTVEGMKVIGITDRFREIIETQDEDYAHVDEIVGFKMVLISHQPTVVTLKDVEFTSFDDTKSNNRTLIEVQPGAVLPQTAELKVMVQGITVPTGTDPYKHFKLNGPVALGIKNVYLTDVDSSMNPGIGSTTGTSTVIANTADMKAKVDMSKCTMFPDSAYYYCKNTAL